MTWTTSLVARGLREAGNGYKKPNKMREQRKTAFVREGEHGHLQMLLGG